MASHEAEAVKAPAEPQSSSRTNIQVVNVLRDSDSDNRVVVDAPAIQNKDSSLAAAKGRDYRRDPFWRTSASLPYPRLRDHPPDPFQNQLPTATIYHGNPDSKYQYFLIELKNCICKFTKGKHDHFADCALKTEPLINPFTRLLQRCLNCDSFWHSTYACLEPFKGSLITWHANETFPSAFGCLEFAKDIHPGQYEITAQEWASLRNGWDPAADKQEGITRVAQKPTEFLPRPQPPPVRSQPSEAELASAAVLAFNPVLQRQVGPAQGNRGTQGEPLCEPAVRVPSSLDTLIPPTEEVEQFLRTFKPRLLGERTLAALGHRYHPQFAQSLDDEILKERANIRVGTLEKSTSLAAILHPEYVPSTSWTSSAPFAGPIRAPSSGPLPLNTRDPGQQFRLEQYVGPIAGPEFHHAYATRARYLDNRHFVAAPPSQESKQNLVPAPGCGYTHPQGSTPQAFDATQSYGVLVPCYPPAGPYQYAPQRDFIGTPPSNPVTPSYTNPPSVVAPNSFPPLPVQGALLNFGPSLPRDALPSEIYIPALRSADDAPPVRVFSAGQPQNFARQPRNLTGPSGSTPVTHGNGHNQGPSPPSYSPSPEGFGPSPSGFFAGTSRPSSRDTFQGQALSQAPQGLYTSVPAKRSRAQLQDFAPNPKKQRKTAEPANSNAPAKPKASRKTKRAVQSQSLLEKSGRQAEHQVEAAKQAYDYLDAEATQPGGPTPGSAPRLLPNLPGQYNPSPNPNAYLWTPPTQGSEQAESSSVASSRRGSAFRSASLESSQQLQSQVSASTPATSRRSTPVNRSSQDPARNPSALDPALFHP